MFSENIKRIHFVGIGGIGMSGLAEILSTMGYQVSGSDLVHNKNCEKLVSMGIQVAVGHNRENVHYKDLVIHTSAVSTSNVEYNEAVLRNIPILSRGELLAKIFNSHKGLAVAGTHGKTTTTSMLASILSRSAIEAGYIIGGVVPHLNGHAKLGAGDCLVVEADESDASFLLLNSHYSIITNIDNDHMEQYGSKENLLKAFTDFIINTNVAGTVALNVHDKNLCLIANAVKRNIVFFGIDPKGSDYPNVKYCAKNITYGNFKTEYDLFVEGSYLSSVSILLPGEHNVLNSLGAIAISLEMGVDIETIRSGLSACSIVGRRFELLYKDEMIEIIDDYAHHPTAISSTMDAARATRNNDIYVIWEPHRYSRIDDCLDGFIHCFKRCNKLYILPIYSASESDTRGHSNDSLVAEINKRYNGLARIVDVSQVEELLDNDYSNKTTIIAFGAGKISGQLRSFLASK